MYLLKYQNRSYQYFAFVQKHIAAPLGRGDIPNINAHKSPEQDTIDTNLMDQYNHAKR